MLTQQAQTMHPTATPNGTTKRTADGDLALAATKMRLRPPVLTDGETTTATPSTRTQAGRPEVESSIQARRRTMQVIRTGVTTQ